MVKITKILPLLAFIFITYSSLGQSTFAVDSVFFPNENIWKVKADSNIVYFILGSDSSKVLSLTNSEQVSDLSPNLYFFTQGPFSCIDVWKRNHLFFGTNGDYLIKYENGTIGKLSPPNGISRPGVTSLASDENRVFVGTDSADYSSYDGNNFSASYSSYSFRSPQFESHSGSEYVSFYRIKHYEDTIYQFSYRNDYYSLSMGKLVYRGDKKVNSIFLINSGYYWDPSTTIAATDEGLVRHPFTDNTRVHPVVFMKDTVCYKLNKVPGFILVGTEKGLFKYSEFLGNQGRQPISEVELGADYIVYDIEVEKVNSCFYYIWLATNKGLVKLSYTPVIVQSYDFKTICNGEEISLSVSSDCFTSFQWQFDNTDIPDATLSSVTINSPGNYRVKCITQNSDTVISDNLYIAPDSTYYKYISYSKPRDICRGDTLILEGNSNIYSRQKYYSYQWYKDQKALEGETNAQLKAYAEGEYFLKITTCSGKEGYTDTVEISFGHIPKETINYYSSNVCKGDSIYISCYDYHLSYLWTFNGDSIGTGNGIYAKETGFYQVFTKGWNGCLNESAPTFIEFPEPGNLQITRKGNTLIASYDRDTIGNTKGPYSYQWYKDGYYLWEYSKEYSPYESGNYSVTVSSYNDCSVQSPSYFFRPETTTAIEDEVFSNNLTMAPNPTNGITFLNIPANTYSVLDFKLFDINGQLINHKILKSPLPDKYEVDLRSLPDNHYFIVITDYKKTATKKLILNKN